VNRLCQAAGVSRAGYYRFRWPPESKPGDMTLRNQIQHIALRWPAYGYCRVHAELIRQGWKINHKRVLRLMRSDNLLCVRRRKFLFTTDSRHGLPIYPNLAEGLVVTSIDQLWWPILLTSACKWSLFIWPSCWMRSRGAVWAGHCGEAWKRLWRWKLSTWRCGVAGRNRGWCITLIAACSTLPWTMLQNSNNTASASA
jgi:transposase InsO family protein